MTDKELLELAAKAAGIKALPDPHGSLRNCTTAHPATNIFALPLWNPLADDGDRYQLAKKLKFVVDFEMCTVNCDIAGESHCFQWGGAISEERAFVVAAAEIGKLL